MLVASGGWHTHTDMSRRRDRLESRRYSNLMDLPGAGAEAKTSSASHLWVNTKNEFSSQERRFFKDFRPFFLLCQLSGMFPNKLNWRLSFSWGYWATYFCLANVCVMIILLIFYVSQVRRQLLVYSYTYYTGCPVKLFPLGYLLFFWLLLTQIGKVWMFLKNSGNLLQDRHKNFENQFRNS